jgi:uncharacterized protein
MARVEKGDGMNKPESMRRRQFLQTASTAVAAAPLLARTASAGDDSSTPPSRPEIVDAYCTLGTERETRLSAGELLAQMDAARIARAVIAPEDREIAVHNAAGNDRILSEADKSGGRFFPACTVNPWFGEKAIREFRRTAGRGACIVVLAPALQGFILGDELTDDLFGAAADIDIPVYVHTGPHSASAPTQLLVTAERHPKTRFIMGHCGSTDYWYDMTAALEMKLGNVWFETSFVRPWQVGGHVQKGYEHRFLFGSSAPRHHPGHELEYLNHVWPIAEHPAMYGANLLALLKEDQR